MPFFSTKKIGMNFDELLINLVWWVTGKAKVLTRRLWLETVWNKLGPNNLEVGKPSSFIFVIWKKFKVKIWRLTHWTHDILSSWFKTMWFLLVDTVHKCMLWRNNKIWNSNLFRKLYFESFIQDAFHLFHHPLQMSGHYDNNILFHWLAILLNL